MQTAPDLRDRSVSVRTEDCKAQAANGSLAL